MTILPEIVFRFHFEINALLYPQRAAEEAPHGYTKGMQNTSLVTTGVALVAVVIGVFFFIYGPNGLSYPMPSDNGLFNPSPSTTVPFEELARGQKSSVTARVNYLITSTEQLKKLWSMVDATSTPPTIDFKTHSVMAVFAGQQPTAGYAISVSKIVDVVKRVVSVTIKRPGKDCISAQMLTTPYQLVSVPVTSLSLTHENATTTTACP